MRISYWSSDVCSSDLRPPAFERQCVGQLARDRQPHDDGHVITQLAYEIDGEEGRREIFRALPGAEKDDQPREIAVAKRRAQSLAQSDRFGGRGGKPWFGEPRDDPGADQPGDAPRAVQRGDAPVARADRKSTLLNSSH